MSDLPQIPEAARATEKPAGWLEHTKVGPHGIELAGDEGNAIGDDMRNGKRVPRPLRAPSRYGRCGCWVSCGECSQRERAEMEFYAPSDPAVEAELTSLPPARVDYPYDDYDPADAREQLMRRCEQNSSMRSPHDRYADLGREGVMLW